MLILFVSLNNRIKAYISTNMSVTDYMIFAVDEIALVQMRAYNMVFLEFVLQYYNHTPLIQGFWIWDLI